MARQAIVLRGDQLSVINWQTVLDEVGLTFIVIKAIPQKGHPDKVLALSTVKGIYCDMALSNKEIADILSVTESQIADVRKN